MKTAILVRIKLFLFFTAMAWVSAVAPRHGRQMVEDAGAGRGARHV